MAAPATTVGGMRGRAPMNPVLARELRIRLRGRRAWILLTIYLLLLAVILFIVYSVESGTNAGGDAFSLPSPTRFASVGRGIYEWILLFMLLLVLFLVPGFTSGAIAGERERQTLVPLQVTLLRPWQVIVGKLAASFAFLALLVVAAAPFLGVAYLIGGVTIDAVLKGVLVVLYTGVVVGAVTVGCSAVFRRVQIATVVSYALVLVMLVGTLIVWGAAAAIDSSRGTDEANPPKQVLYFNPLFLAADVLIDEDAVLNDVASPFEWMAEVLHQDTFGGDQDVVFEGDVALPGRGGVIVEQNFGDDGGAIVGFDEFGNPIFAGDSDEGFPFWAGSMIALYVVAVLAATLAVRRLRTPAVVER
jgi:ABC-type transport system involved in multi-copper enzyme maturation permease subunit